MRKQGNTGFLLWEVLVGLAVLTFFLGWIGFLFRSSWALIQGGRRRIIALGRVIDDVESGRGEVRVVKGDYYGGYRAKTGGYRAEPGGYRAEPGGYQGVCRYRFVEVDGVWVCARV